MDARMGAVLVLVLGVAAASPPGAVAKRTPPQRRAPATCLSHRGTRIASSPTARLFSVASGPPPAAYVSEQPVELYGCRWPRGHIFDLGPLADPSSGALTSVRHPRLVGAFAGYVLDTVNELQSKYTGTSDETQRVVVVNLRSGRKLVHVTAVKFTAPSYGGPGAPVSPDVTSLAVTTHGWAAWSVLSSGAPTTVVAFDSAGRRTLDSGNIDPASLVASGDAVTWTKGGIHASANLN